jgi:hypothetical protein
MIDIQRFVEKFHKENFTLMVIQGDGLVFSSRKDGLQPLIEVIEADRDCLLNALVIDKIVGRAAALLMCYGKSRQVFGDLMSERALEVLNAFGIQHDYEKLVPYILNRDTTDLCPFEKLVDGITDPEEGYKLISENLRLMKKK